jgi:hypothetical protein
MYMCMSLCEFLSITHLHHIDKTCLNTGELLASTTLIQCIFKLGGQSENKTNKRQCSISQLLSVKFFSYHTPSHTQ